MAKTSGDKPSKKELERIKRRLRDKKKQAPEKIEQFKKPKPKKKKEKK